jgi:hypothetical protein
MKSRYFILFIFSILFVDSVFESNFVKSAILLILEYREKKT